MADRPRIALARAYALLGELVAGPLDEGLVERAGKSPLLGEALGDSPSLDELAADHHRAFGWCAFPHQGVYLDPNGWADGSSAQQLRALDVLHLLRLGRLRLWPDHRLLENIRLRRVRAPHRQVERRAHLPQVDVRGRGLGRL